MIFEYNKNGTNVPEQPSVPPMPSLSSTESFSAEFKATQETKEVLKQIIGEVSVFTADFIKYENKETGETAEFVSKRKLREVLEKMREYRDMEIKGVNFYERPGVAERCFDLLQEVVSQKKF